MRIISRMLRQTAVYWPPTGYDGSGNPTFGPPVQVRCRWEASDAFIRGQSGALEAVFPVMVYVDRDVLLDGMLLLGTLGALTAAQKSDPFGLERAFIIAKFDKLPTLKATQFLRTAYLSTRGRHD